MTEFSAPASTQGIDLKTALGHLLLVSPLSQETGISTTFGPSDAIRADVVDLDTGEEFSDILIFPRVLQGQLRPKIGGKVLGRLGQGTAKAGQSAPWLLQDFTAEDAAKASAFIAKQKQPAFTAAGTSDSDAPF